MKKNGETKRMTLRECKRLLTQLMDNYADEMPIELTITHNNKKDVIDLVPKNFKHRPHTMNLTIQNVSPSEIELAQEPGLYMAQEQFQMNDVDIVTNYYGLFVDPDESRDLRFFETEDKCLQWLDKKIKSLHSV